MKFIPRRNFNNFKNFNQPSFREIRLKQGYFADTESIEIRLNYSSFGKLDPFEVYEVPEVFPRIKLHMEKGGF